MKQLNLTFDDKDFEKLVEAKEKTCLTWREFLINLVEEKNKRG